MLVTGVVLGLAIDGGGYDVVVRQEAALACWWLLGLGFLFGYLPRFGPPASVRLPLIAATGLVAWMAISLAWTDSDERALEEIARALGYLGGGVLVFSTIGPRTWRYAAAGLTVAAVGVCGLAMFSRLDPSALHSSAAFVEAFGTKRLAYPLGYWNAVGAVGAAALVMAIAWSAHARAPGRRALALASAPLAGAVVYLSYSRGAIVAAVLGAGAAIALSKHRRVAAEHAAAAALASAAVVLVIRSEPQIAQGAGSGGAWIVLATLLVAAAVCAQAASGARVGARLRRRRRRSALPRVALNVAGIAGLIVALALVSHPAATPVKGREGSAGRALVRPARSGDIAGRLISTSGPRGELWSTGLHAFRDHPIIGLGAGSYEFYWDRHTSNGDPLRDAHSVVITSMAELGLPGLALIGALAVGLVALCVQARRRARGSPDIGAVVALVAGFLVFATSAAVDWSYEIPAVTALGLACVAVAGSSLSSRERPVRRGLGSVLLATVAIVAGLVQVPGIVGNQLVRASADRAADGDTDRAADLASDAVTAEPWAATPRLQQAFVALRAGDPDAAVGFAEEAVAREPDNYYTRFLLAQYQLQAGRRSAGIESLKAVKALRPAISAQIHGAIRAVRDQGSDGV